MLPFLHQMAGSFCPIMPQYFDVKSPFFTIATKKEGRVQPLATPAPALDPMLTITPAKPVTK